MSTSKDDLQICIEKLSIYCEKWKLELNIKKTKIVIFNHKFYFKSNHREVVKEYKYLGFTFSCSGSTIPGITNLINQAKKAWFAIRSYLSSSKNKNIKTYTLFDSQIKPIVLYACEAWADY